MDPDVYVFYALAFVRYTDIPNDLWKSSFPQDKI